MTAEAVSKDGHLRRLRSKTVKMIQEPDIDDITAEIEILTQWLPHVVERNEGLDLRLDTCTDDDLLQELHSFVTGSDETITWQTMMGV